jgi:hypothetical protein
MPGLEGQGLAKLALPKMSIPVLPCWLIGSMSSGVARTVLMWKTGFRRSGGFAPADHKYVGSDSMSHPGGSATIRRLV